MATFHKSIKYALTGISCCFKREPHFKVHATFAVGIIAAGFFFKIAAVEWLVIIICIGAVLTAELINTALEELCNIFYKEEHTGIKLVKDMSAGAVLIAAISAVVAGIVIFIPKIILLIQSIKR